MVRTEWQMPKYGCYWKPSIDFAYDDDTTAAVVVLMHVFFSSKKNIKKIKKDRAKTKNNLVSGQPTGSFFSPDSTFFFGYSYAYIWYNAPFLHAKIMNARCMRGFLLTRCCFGLLWQLNGRLVSCVLVWQDEVVLRLNIFNGSTVCWVPQKIFPKKYFSDWPSQYFWVLSPKQGYFLFWPSRNCRITLQARATPTVSCVLWSARSELCKASRQILCMNLWYRLPVTLLWLGLHRYCCTRVSFLSFVCTLVEERFSSFPDSPPLTPASEDRRSRRQQQRPSRNRNLQPIGADDRGWSRSGQRRQRQPRGLAARTGDREPLLGNIQIDMPPAYGSIDTMIPPITGDPPAYSAPIQTSQTDHEVTSQAALQAQATADNSRAGYDPLLVGVLPLVVQDNNSSSAQT